MNIALEVTRILKRRAGIENYSHQLFRLLPVLDNKNQYNFFYLLSKRSDKLLTCKSERLKITTRIIPSRLIWWLYAGYLPIDLFIGKADIIHCTWHQMFRALKAKLIYTVSDLAFIRYRNFYTYDHLSYMEKWLRYALREAAHYIAISQSTRKDLIELCGVSPEKITVVYCGVEEGFKPLPCEYVKGILKKYNLIRGYILFVGVIQPRKNISSIIKAYNIFRQNHPGAINNLVIAGSRGWLYEEILKEIEESSFNKNIIYLGYVAQADLPAIYNGASLFIYPSFYEGFGLPVLEAMACGTPVICANTSSFPEIASEAAVLVNPEDISQIAKSIEEIITHRELTEELSKKGIEKASGFSWEKTTRGTIRVYENLNL